MCCNRRGFSLLEVMVVLVIIGFIATLVTVNVRSRMAQAKQNVARAEVAALTEAVEQFNLVFSRYPSRNEGLEALTEPSAKLPEPLIVGGVPRDPWGNRYEYVNPGLEAPFEVVSYGADGREGGAGADTDIISSRLRSDDDGL